MAAGLNEFEWETLHETGAEADRLGEWEEEAGQEGELADWASRQWNGVRSPGSWQRAAALAAARSALSAYGGAGRAIADLLPAREFEGEYEAEFENEEEGEVEAGELHEINPARKVYLDAMMEHIAHEAAEAESEAEAAEGFLPLIPMIAGKLLPLAAKVLPKVAGKVMPRIARAVTRAAPRLSHGVNNIARTLYRDPRTRQLVRTIPSIARRTITSVARQAAAGRPVTPAMAQRVLAQQAYRVLTRPHETARVLRRNARMDRRYHVVTRTPLGRAWSGTGPGVWRGTGPSWTSTGPASWNYGRPGTGLCRSCGTRLQRQGTRFMNCRCACNG